MTAGDTLSFCSAAAAFGAPPCENIRVYLIFSNAHTSSRARARTSLSESRGQLPRCLAVGRVRFRAVAGKTILFFERRGS
jgi:hypothetical protein